MSNAVLLVDATFEILDAAAEGGARLGDLLSADIAPGWLDFPEVLPKTLAAYAKDKGPTPWGTLFFLLDSPRTLIGWGGYKGPPRNGEVEIGYAIAPGYRSRGLATAAAKAMVTRAFADLSTEAVAATTLDEENASTAVLRKLGFKAAGIVADPDEGAVRKWRLLRPHSPMRP